MDLTWIFASLLVSLVTPILSGIISAIKWIIMLPFYQMLVNESVLVRALNSRISSLERGNIMQCAGTAIIPASGFYILELGGHYVLVNRYYLTNGNRSTIPEYHLYSFYQFKNFINTLITDPGTFELWFEPASQPWQVQNAEMRRVPLPSINPYKWQKQAIASLIKMYNDNTKKGYKDHAGMLIWGGSGQGKSSVASYLAQYFERQGLAPVIVRGFNPMVAGIDFATLENRVRRTARTPLIIVLDEYDKIAEHALIANKNSFTACYAHDKGSLCIFRDRLDTLQYTIIIATMNSTPPTTGELLPFFRHESFPLRIKADRKNE